MDARYHQSGAMCSSLYKKMHTAAAAATRKAVPSSLSGLLLSNPFSRNVADAGSLNEFDAGRFSVCLFQDPLLYEDGQGFALEMTPNFKFKFICKHLLKLCHSAWYRATNSKKQGERDGCSAGSEALPLLNWTITRCKAKQLKRLTATPKTKDALDPELAWLSRIESKNINDIQWSFHSSYRTWRNALCELCPQQATQV